MDHEFFLAFLLSACEPSPVTNAAAASNALTDATEMNLRSADVAAVDAVGANELSAPPADEPPLSGDVFRDQ